MRADAPVPQKRKKGPATSSTRRTTPSSGSALRCSAAATSALPPGKRIQSIAVNDSPTPASSRPLPLRKFSQRFFGGSDVVHRELPGLDQVRHHGLRSSAEQSEQFIDQSGLRRVARNHGFENMRVADLFHTAYRFLSFEPIDRGLDGGVCRPVTLRKRFLNLANGCLSVIP